MAPSVKRSAVLALTAGTLLTPRSLLRAQTPPKIRVGVGVVESYSEGSYAQAMGFFKDAGLDADVQTLPNGGALTAALVGGSLDFATTNGGSMSNAYMHGLPIYNIAPSGLYTSASPTTVLVTTKDSPIGSAKDLNGKRVAVSTLHDLMQAAIMKWIDDGGGDSSSVNFFEVNNANLIPTLQAKRADAAALLEPQLTQRKDDVRIISLPYDALAKRLMISGWITTRSYYEANRPIVQRFLAVMRQTADWANKNPRATAEILARLTKIPLETVVRMNHNVFGTVNDPALIQPTIDASARYGFLPRAFPASELFPPRA